jgi:hypothetical protein
MADDAGDSWNVGAQFVIEIVDRFVHRKHGKIGVDAAMVIDDQTDRSFAYAKIVHVRDRTPLCGAPL